VPPEIAQLSPKDLIAAFKAHIAAQGLTEAEAWERIVAGLNGPESRKGGNRDPLSESVRASILSSSL
jgi:hypothetical protein